MGSARKQPLPAAVGSADPYPSTTIDICHVDHVMALPKCARQFRAFAVNRSPPRPGPPIGEDPLHLFPIDPANPTLQSAS